MSIFEFLLLQIILSIFPSKQEFLQNEINVEI